MYSAVAMVDFSLQTNVNVYCTHLKMSIQQAMSNTPPTAKDLDKHNIQINCLIPGLKCPQKGQK